jgi:hypothetical protein
VNRPLRGRHGYRHEPQYRTPNGWVVARQRPHRHSYELLHDGTSVGWLLCRAEGWRWLRLVGAQRKPRESQRVYGTWQAAAAALSRTSTGRQIAGDEVPARVRDWLPVLVRTGQLWEPTPETLSPTITASDATSITSPAGEVR